MIRITFKNLERSELAREAVEERLQQVIERFPELSQSRIQVSLCMDNSPQQSGPDLFRVKVRIEKGKFDGVILEKSASNLYLALAQVSEYLLERLNRAGDKVRVKVRTQERKAQLRMVQS